MMVDFDTKNPAFEPDDWEEDIGDNDDLPTLMLDPDVMSSSDWAAVQTYARSSSRPLWMTTTIYGRWGPYTIPWQRPQQVWTRWWWAAMAD